MWSHGARLGQNFRVSATALRLALVGLFATIPLAARAQSCVQEREVVLVNSQAGWQAFGSLMAATDFDVYRVTIDDVGNMYILGDLKQPVPGSFTNRPYTIVCNPEDGLKLLELQHVVLSNLADGGVTALSFGANAAPNASWVEAAANFTAKTLVGFVDRGPFTTYHAFRWTEAGGAVDLGTLTPASNTTLSSRATGVSNDGSVVVGYSETGNGFAQHAFRWTAASGMVDLGVPAGASRSARAHDVNRDGTVIVGEAEFQDAATFSGIRNSAFRWTSSGFQNLGALQAGYFTRANDVTPDGSVVVGEGGIEIVVGNSSTNGSRAFRWMSSSGIQNLGALAGHRSAVANAVSDNGSVVVGTSQPETGPSVAFRWTQATGMQDLRQVLVASGVNMAGIQLLSAVSVTGNGQFIAGAATTPTTPSGESISYLVQFCDAATATPCLRITFSPANPDFTLTAGGASSLSVRAGQTVTAPLTITPAGGFNRAVGFTCSGLPAGSTCSFSPATVTATTAASTTLTITTTAPSLAVGPDGGWMVAMLAGPMFLLYWPVRHGHSSGRRRFRFVALVALALMASCGGGGGDDSGATAPPPPPPSGGTPAGSYAVTVTASTTTGTPVLTKSVNLTLNVTR